MVQDFFKYRGRTAVVFAGVIAGGTASAQAASHAILEYSFPISWNGSGVVADISPYGNNGAVQGSPAVSTALPTGGIGRSLTTNSGGILTSGTTELKLLTNNAVATNGGFSFEAWFRWDGTANASWPTQKIIDYSGTESLQLFNPNGTGQTAGEVVQFAFNGSTSAANAISFSISANTWYHAIAIFDSGTHTVASDGSLAGTATFILSNGSTTQTGTLSVSKTNQGDGLNRPIGVGILGIAASNLVNFDGQIYQPTVSLGVIPHDPDGIASLNVPEPASIGVLAALAAPLLLRRSRRNPQ